MKIIVTSVVILSVVSVAGGQIIRNLRRKVSGGRKAWASSAVMMSMAIVVLSSLLAFRESFSLCILAMDMMPSVVVMWLMTSFFFDEKRVKRLASYLYLLNPALVLLNLSSLKGYTLPLSDRTALAGSSIMASFAVMLFMYWIYDRVGNVKMLMKCSSVWTVVSLTVDVVYLYFVVAGVAAVQLGLYVVGVFLLGGVAVAAGLRIMTDSKFILWQSQETLIVESMKLTSVSSAADASRIEDVYKELYERIVSYFEVKKPFLDSALTINDLVRDLYTNKLYISKAISQFTGRNFCQFVNYYRVRHSMECFRENNEMKVHELAAMSGFNSVVSYNMAFRLFMGENPSEWCRKERGRLIKSGK